MPKVWVYLKLSRQGTDLKKGEKWGNLLDYAILCFVWSLFCYNRQASKDPLATPVELN